jgi:hypothetical protein
VSATLCCLACCVEWLLLLLLHALCWLPSSLGAYTATSLATLLLLLLLQRSLALLLTPVNC